MTSTNTNHNDVLAAANASLSALFKAERDVSHRFGTFMYSVWQIIGDVERFKIGAVNTWADKTDQRKAVAKAIGDMLTDDIVSDKNSAPQVKLLANQQRARVKANVNKAVDCLAAMHVIGTAEDVYATYVDGGWRLPLAWFEKEGIEFFSTKKGPHKDGCCSFTERNVKVTVLAQDAEGQAIAHAFTVTPDSLIEQASIRPSRVAQAKEGAATADASTLKGAAETVVNAMVVSDTAPTAFGNAAEDGSIANNLIAWVVTHYRAEVLNALGAAEVQPKVKAA